MAANEETWILSASYLVGFVNATKQTKTGGRTIMRKQTFLASFVMTAFVLTMMIAPAASAPMFPDLPQEHWAKDAVAALAAKGLVEGYPDGTFKGDRAATRYEVAMVVARLLAKIEQEEATFA